MTTQTHETPGLELDDGQLDENQLFQLPAPGSIWTKLAFQPTYDPFDVARTVYMVATKQATVVAFTPFDTQQHFYQGIGMRNVVLKPRQVGSTTLWLMIAHIIAWTTPNVNILVITHLKTATAALRETCQNWTKWLNEHFDAGINIGVDNAEEMEFIDMNSRIFFGTSGTPGVGRSKTIHMGLFSEVAHWVGDEYGGIVESMPDNGLIITESTPAGAGGTYYDLYTGKNSYVKHFAPWFLESSRRIQLPEGTKLTLTDDEQALVLRYGLDDEQIAWRRWKIGDMKANGSKVPFEQEYPEDDISCFTAGAKAAFPTRIMVRLIERARAIKPVQLSPVQGESYDPGGELVVWHHPIPGRHYLLTGDVGVGHEDGDLSYATVFDVQTHKHVASLRGHWTSITFGRLCYDLGNYYNEAYAAIERNGVGHEACTEMAIRLGYKNFHWEEKADSSDREEKWRPGVNIPPGARTPLLTGLIQALVDGEIDTADEEILKQMASAQMVRGKISSGWQDRIEIPKSVHDDGVMAYAHAVKLLRTLVIVGDRAKPVHAL